MCINRSNICNNVRQGNGNKYSYETRKPTLGGHCHLNTFETKISTCFS